MCMTTHAAKGFDAIVVGTGFGGSVAAARLAQKGLSVLILERGPWWGPAHRERAERDRREFPRGLIGSRKLLRSLRIARSGNRRERVFNVDGLLEGHLFEHLNAITASGVGGGSHVYTNILDEPEPTFFDAYPAEISGDELHPYFERVRAMLRPAPVPGLPAKDQVFARALRAAGLPAPQRPELAIAWGDPDHPDRPQTVINPAGVKQSTSTYRSDVFVGCEDGSKTTLDLTYVPLALRHGAEIRPLCEVLAVGQSERGYWVQYRDHRSDQELREEAPRLVLAAGGLNTQRLLFAARDAHGSLPRIPARLGRRFSPNGDRVALLWKTALRSDFSLGPSVGALSKLFDEHGEYRFCMGQVAPPTQALPLFKRALRRSTFLFCMGRDASRGTIGFDGTGLITSMGRSLDPDLYDHIDRSMMEVARHYEPRRIFANTLSRRGAERLFTVHPLGGCSIGTSPEDGVTDHRGQVFGHPGLFVADGSLYPCAPGIAPSMTIAALAERQAELMQ